MSARLWGPALVLVLAAGGGEVLAQKKEPAAAVAFSPDASRVATASGKVITVADVKTDKVLMRMAGHQGDVTTLAFSADGKLLASGAKDKAVGLWDVATGRMLLKVSAAAPVESVLFSADGRSLLAREADGTRREFDVATGKELRRFKEK